MSERVIQRRRSKGPSEDFSQENFSAKINREIQEKESYKRNSKQKKKITNGINRRRIEIIGFGYHNSPPTVMCFAPYSTRQRGPCVILANKIY